MPRLSFFLLVRNSRQHDHFDEIKARFSIPEQRDAGCTPSGEWRGWKGGTMGKLGLAKLACVMVAVCSIAIASPAQSFTTLHSFAGYPTQGGAWPYTGLIQATDGNFYGTTSSGGAPNCTFGCGTIFEATADGTFTTLYSFQVPNYGPSSGLIQATNGNFYGTTGGGGGSANCSFSDGCGTVYEVTTDGTLTTLYSFSEPAAPLSGVIQATNGNFYGTTYYGGSSGNCLDGCGTIFELTPGGTLTTLYSFSGADGAEPGALIQAKDGNFYGTTLNGGAGSAYGYPGNGTVFKISPGGKLTTLYSFCAQTNCSDGGAPGSLLQATDGHIYGTTLYGGANGNGTVFEIPAQGRLTTVYSFCGEKNCSDGSEPTGLIQSTDGNLYGTTVHGGGDSVGTIFEITAGTLTTIHKFTGGSSPNGADPFAGLMQAADGNFYGTTTYGGTSTNCSAGCGTIFTFGPATATLPSTSLHFGTSALDETSTAKAVTLKNSGVALLTISNITINGNFAISSNTCTGAALTAGKICKVSVTFTPTALGQQTGTLSFADNAANSPQTVTLSGTGVEPATLTPASASYASQMVGTTSAAKTFTLTNNQTVALTSIVISTAGNFAVSTTTCTTSLAEKGKCTISVNFAPTATGSRTGELSVSDNASNSPQLSSLKGTGK